MCCVHSRSVINPFLPTAIQRRGCLLIRLVFDETYLNSATQSSNLAYCIVNVLLCWRKEPRTQAEVGGLVLRVGLFIDAILCKSGY